MLTATPHVALGIGQSAQPLSNENATTIAEWHWSSDAQDQLLTSWTADDDAFTRTDLFTTAGWSKRAFADVELPLNVFGAQLAADKAHITIEQLQTVPATPPTRPTLADELRPPASATPLPNSPIFVLRTGTSLGMKLVVLAFSPFIQINGEWRFVTAVQARVDGVRPTTDDPLVQSDEAMSAASASANTPIAPPTNPAQPNQMWRIVVSRGGIQSLSGAALANAGIDLSAIDANRLRLQFDGTDIATQLIDGNNNGRLDAQDELRFFARTPGDRWNRTDTYWLTVATFAVRAQMRDASNGATPAGESATIYDVAEWMQPAIVATTTVDAANNMVASANQTLVIAGSGTVLAPAIAQRATADLSRPLNARGIYIAPAALHAALAPLLAHRQANGWLVSAVDTQAIYDSWSYGQVSPAAIRNFLRYAASTWRTAPLYVVMVGDGNYDAINPNNASAPMLVPPYLANVDPWLGETACESCYAQLDGDDPLDDLVPDLYFGRLPVKNATQLAAVVDKIIAYETAPVGSWMWRNVFVADNFQEADGAKDEAGNFSGFEDTSVGLQPIGVEIQRAYYDPFAQTTNGVWRLSDAAKARERTIALWNAGAAIMNYSGHGLNGQWAYMTARTQSLLTTADAATLSNGSRLPFVLSWACLTGSFQSSESDGTSIDEQLVLAPNGGAIGTWSSTGLGVMYSHEFLRDGFYKALWNAPTGSLTLGKLTHASLMYLFQNAACCDEPIRTYNLLGDPMTPLRVALPTNRVWVPTVSR